MKAGASVPACAKGIMNNGLTAAAEALSTMVGRTVSITSPQVELVPLSDVPKVVGGAENAYVAIYLGLEGDLTGHLVFLLSEASAISLMEALLDERAASALSLTDLQRSALAEVGNVSGCAFLNFLADAIRMRITPTTPLIVCDMAGAILDSMLADVGQSTSTVLIIQTKFVTDDSSQITGHFLLLPNADGLRRVFGALEAECR